jgi:hypothetical protein
LRAPRSGPGTPAAGSSVRTRNARTFDADGDGFSPAQGDCDDSDPRTFPGALEVCDGRDNDCNGAVDDHAIDAFPVFLDGDGWGNGAFAISVCAAPPGYATRADDCDDADPAVHPGAAEICDGVDHDCDGRTSTPTVVWSAAVGLPGNPRIAVDALGNSVVIGQLSGTIDLGGGPLMSGSVSDFFVASFDAAGHHLWSHRFGGTGVRRRPCRSARR